MSDPTLAEVQSEVKQVESDLALVAAARATPDFAAIVSKWANEKIQNSPVSQNVAAWNHFQASLADLVSRLQKGS